MKRRTTAKTQRRQRRKKTAPAAAAETTAEKVVGFVRGFKPQSRADCRAAIQNDSAPEFNDEHGFFEPLRTPTHELDWLAQFREDPETYEIWLHGYRRKPRPGRDTLYLLPIGVDLDSASLLQPLLAFARAFFAPVFSRVEMLPRTALRIDVPTRNCHPYHKGEYVASHVQVCID